MKDPLGDRMKQYEAATTSQTSLNMAPLMVRVDGKRFSSYTKGFTKPYCNAFIKCMCYTAKQLAKQLQAKVAYVQSDEITFCLRQETYTSQHIFNGKIFKVVSCAASYATYFFNKAARKYLPAKYASKVAVFDARAFNVPNIEEATNCILWRQQDCIRNSILGLAQYTFGAKNITGVSTLSLKEKLDLSVNNYTNAPEYYKYGVFILKKDGKYKRKIIDLVTLQFADKVNLFFDTV